MADQDNVEHLYWGQTKQEQQKVIIFTQDEDLQEAVSKWTELATKVGT